MVTIYSLSTSKLDNESELDYINRICTIKQDLDFTWKDVAETINNELGTDFSDSWYRKNYAKGAFASKVAEVTTTSTEDCAGNCEYCPELNDCLADWADNLSEEQQVVKELEHKLAMKKIEVSDLVVQNNAYIRRLSREQTIKDIAADYAQVMNKDKVLEVNKPVADQNNSTCEGILLISDWHYGMVCDNYWNKFDPDICVKRVNHLLNEVIKYVMQNNITHLHVLDLADLIAGRIHTQIRIESRFDVITQTMDVAELLAEFLYELSCYTNVSFYSCLDNHSRLEPNKKESMDLESLARIIPWYLRDRLKNHSRITIYDNDYSPDIITCTVAGHSVIGVHGDNDPPARALERLTMMTHEHYDLLCTAHLHHFSADEDHETIVVGNASLMGVDSYSEKLRLTSKPSQTLIVSTPENVCESIHRIVLN